MKVDEVYAVWGRTGERPARNRAWLANFLTHLRYHDLVEPVYDYRNSRKVLVAIKLTPRGMEALDWRLNSGSNPTSAAQSAQHVPVKTVSRVKAVAPAQPSRLSPAQPSVDLATVMRQVAELRQQNPDFEIIFDVRLKAPSA